MKNKRRRSAQTKGDNGRPDLFDFINQMPDDVLEMILSLMPIKDAVITSRLSTRWRYVWRNLIILNFDGTETLRKMARDEKLCDLEVAKYIDQVDEVINGYTHPRVHDFRIRFDLDYTYFKDINKWIQFALEKKVETLELNLLDKNYSARDPNQNFDFWLLPSKAMAQEMLSLKKLFLSGLNLNEITLYVILKYSPHLETLDMYGSVLFPHIYISGQDINLKHIKLVSCSGFESVSFYGFDLVSFIYCGPEIKFFLTDLPKLKKLDIREVSVRLENNVFFRITSSALDHLQVLVLDMFSPKKHLDVNAILKFPSVKKLMLSIDAEEDDCLRDFALIAQACPSLEIFSIYLDWYSPVKTTRKVRHVAAPDVHQHLKLLEIFRYYGRISDLELAVYVIDNAAALKKIVIDPCCHADGEDYCHDTREELLKREQVARSLAKCQLTPILPSGVELAIL